jgi:hypothetical protein
MAAFTVQGTNLLKGALKEFEPRLGNLDPHAIAVIKRLEGEQRAADAFKIFNIGPKKGARIIQACMEADELARTFDARMRLERRMLGRDGKPGRADKLEKEIADLKAFFGEVNRPRSDYLSAGITYSDEDVSAVKRGLYLLSNAISARRQVAEETLLRLGATRKNRGQAGKTAAIGWIAEAVRHRCGRPHLRATAELAEVVLRCEVSLDRLRGAEQTRRREWRR